ncbi:MATE family efflux transporter [Actinomyces sp. zg-332]|uniref:MATE family efflux transporter n=1 Tax=Actinomyces sp. zg-332 TaxID=2708340 RepID=UPI00141EFE3A|nr:MATE family efflux transporter [Actinomyces sp. zg-332]QPK93852.1 MATE family efflux transporter [Actinomyces sp. zg-332]
MSNNEEEKGQRKNPLAYKSIRRLLFSFAWPTILGSVANSMYNIVDQIFIGHGVGYVGNAATNVSHPFIIICLAIGLLAGIGSATNYSVELGRGNTQKAKEVAGTAISLVGIFGILFVILLNIFLPQLLVFFGATDEILPYAIEYVRILSLSFPLLLFAIALFPLMRADGNFIMPMVSILFGVTLNTILNAIFVLGLGLGMKAVATATVISEVFATGMLFFFIPKFKNVKFTFKDFIPKKKAIKTIVALGMSPFIFQISATFIQIILNNLLNHYGSLSAYGSEIPIAIAGIVSKINIIFISLVIGFTQGAQPIIGYNYGARNYERVHQTIKLLLKITLVISVIAFAVFEIFPKELISIFGTADERYFEFGSKYMRITLFFTFIAGASISSSTFFTSIQKPKIGVMLSLLKQVLLLLPLLVILPKFLEIDGILYATPVADFLSFLLAMHLLRLQLKKIPKENKNPNV